MAKQDLCGTHAPIGMCRIIYVLQLVVPCIQCSCFIAASILYSHWCNLRADHVCIKGIKQVTCWREGLRSSQKFTKKAKDEATVYDISSFIALSCKDLCWTCRGAGTRVISQQQQTRYVLVSLKLVVLHSKLFKMDLLCLLQTVESKS